MGSRERMKGETGASVICSRGFIPADSMCDTICSPL